MAHGNEHDRGVAAAIRYLKIAPWLWKSDVNDAVVQMAKVQAGETVVDIGAGMGPAAIQAAKLGAQVVAVEPTPFMRNVLHLRRTVTRTRDLVSVVDGAAEALPVADGQADVVWSVNTMHHWSSPSEGVAEIARAVGTSGRVILVDENFADPRHPDHERWTARQGSHDHDHDHHADHDEDHHHGFSMVDATEIGNMITVAGFGDVVAEERDLNGVPVIAITATISPASKESA